MNAWSRLLQRPGLLVGAIVAFTVLASIGRAFSRVPLLSGDETAHLDYAYEVWHGHLPVFENGISFKPSFGSEPPVQWVSQHPPLFYLLLAPVVGPLIDQGHLYRAVIAGRMINAALAGVVVLSVWWSVKRLWPSSPRGAAVAALVTGLCGTVIAVGGAVYNDLIAVVFTALAIGLAATAIRRGLSTRLVVLMALVAAGGMLSRLVFVVSVVVLIVAALVSPRPVSVASRRSAWVTRGIAVVVIVGASAASSAWFYVRNVRLTGSITGSQPAWAAANLHRVSSSTAETVTDPHFWQGLFSIYNFDLDPNRAQPWLMLFVPCLAALVGAVLAVALRRGVWHWRPGGLLVTMGAAVLVVNVFAQVKFADQGGAAHSRYLLEALPVIAVVIAYGLTRGRWSGLVLTLAWIGGGIALYTWTFNFSVPAPSQSSLRVAHVTYIASLVSLLLAVAVVVAFAIAGPEERREPPAPNETWVSA